MAVVVLFLIGANRVQESTKPVLLLQQGHTLAVGSVAFSPDGKMLASASTDETLKLWEISSGRLIRSFEGHAGTISSVAFSPDGKMLASASSDKTLKLWEISSGQLIRSFEGHTESVSSVAFSPDGKIYASASWDKTLKLWETSSGGLIRSFEGPAGPVSSVAFSSDGKMLASANWDKTLGLWETSSGRLIRSFEGHTESVYSVAFSPDGEMLASASNDKTLKLWEISSGRLIRSFEGHNEGVDSVAFSPDGKMLASASYGGTIKIWSVSSGDLVTSLICFPDGNWVAFTPDNYYQSSAGASKYIAWQVGDRVYEEAQLKSRFNRPDIVVARLRGPRSTPADTAAPTIVITSPSGTEGARVKFPISSLIITGRALDDSGVNEVVIRGKSARLDAHGNFSAEVLLKVGDNQITVTAKDIYGNTAARTIAIRRDEMIAPSGKYVALVIGINAYQHLRALKTAVNDAKEVARVLSGDYGFETRLLLNADASRYNIMTAINEYGRTLTSNDHLLIYYAGHGRYSGGANEAYWQPMDADESLKSNWISASDVTSNIREIPARHILIISDSCYSGAMGRDSSDSKIDSRSSTPEDYGKYLELQMLGTSRHLMASGDNEPVEDDSSGGHSVFANAFLRGLRERDPVVFTAGILFYKFVEVPVTGRSNQTPVYGWLPKSGHEAGSFVFFRRK